MNLISIGCRTINLAALTSARWTEDGNLWLFFGQERMILIGTEAIQVQAVLHEHSMVVPPPTPTDWPITRRFRLANGEVMELVASSAGTVAICLGVASEYLVAQLSIADLARLGALSTELAVAASAAAAVDRAQSLPSARAADVE